MTKQIFISILTCTIAFLSCGSVYGQGNNKKTVAVVPAVGASVSQDVRIGVTEGLREGVFKSGKYTLVARGKAFDQALSEIKFQQGGAVSDNQLTEFGHALGANYVCYATVSKYTETSFRITYEMIDVASGTYVEMNSVDVRNGVDGLLSATDEIAKKLFNSEPTPNNTPASNNPTIPTPAPAPTPRVGDVTNNTSMTYSFNVTDHDFGTIEEKNGNATFVFVLTNNSNATIVITDARISCGCLRTDWSKEPIRQGKTGTITVSYNPLGRPGSFNRTITVIINQSTTLYLKIHGTVV